MKSKNNTYIKGINNKVTPNKMGLCIYNKIAPTVTITVSIINVTVTVDKASLILLASINREIISPLFLFQKIHW